MISWLFRTGRSALDLLGGGLEAAGLRPFALDPDRIVAAARRQTGLRELGELPWPDGLERACASFEAEAGLSPFGRFVVHGALVRMVANRLRLVEARRRHPEVFARPLRPPILVTGLPRSGTTILHRLLSQLPQSRGLPLWQSRQPVHFGALDLRRPRLAVDIQLLRWLAPEVMAKHAFEVDSPEEAIALFDAAGGWNLVLWRIGGCYRYLDWCLAQAPAAVEPAYSAFFDQLRWLQRSCPDTRLVLKTPNHVGFLDAFLAQAPDAVVVQTHRDPAVILPSYLSLHATMHGLACPEPDLPRLGAASLEMWATYTDRALAVREALPPGRVLDVHYEDLRRDAVGQALRVCQAAGLGGSEDLRERLAAELASRPQHRHGKHVYDLADYGLSREQVHARFARYIRRHLPELQGVSGASSAEAPSAAPSSSVADAS